MIYTIYIYLYLYLYYTILYLYLYYTIFIIKYTIIITSIITIIIIIQHLFEEIIHHFSYTGHSAVRAVDPWTCIQEGNIEEEKTEKMQGNW